MDADAEPKSDRVPVRSGGDVAHSLVKAGLGSIPIAGAAASELFALVVSPPIEKRRDEWMADMGERLREVEERGVSLEDLQSSDEFIDTVTRATQIALRNGQEEKREALRNAVMNTALRHAPDDAEREMFLDYIDRFTVWHLRLLALFADPPKWFHERHKRPPELLSGGLSHVLEAAYPELGGGRAMYDQVWRDLYTHGLTGTESLHAMMTGSGLMQPRTSDRGQDFLRFVSAPE